MITHSIEKHRPEPDDTGRVVKNKFIAGSKEHRDFIHKRTIELMHRSQNFLEGTAVTNVNGNTDGTVISLVDDFDMVSWDGLKCKCVEVYWYDKNDITLHHPSELRVKH